MPSALKPRTFLPFFFSDTCRGYLISGSFKPLFMKRLPVQLRSTVHSAPKISCRVPLQLRLRHPAAPIHHGRTLSRPTPAYQETTEEDARPLADWEKRRVKRAQVEQRLAALLRAKEREKALRLVRSLHKDDDQENSWNMILDYDLQDGHFNVAFKTFNDVRGFLSACAVPYSPADEEERPCADEVHLRYHVPRIG